MMRKRPSVSVAAHTHNSFHSSHSHTDKVQKEFTARQSLPFPIIIKTKDQLESHQDIGGTQSINVGKGLWLVDFCPSFVADVHRVLLGQLGNDWHQRLCTHTKQQTIIYLFTHLLIEGLHLQPRHLHRVTSGLQAAANKHRQLFIAIHFMLSKRVHLLLVKW